MVQQTEYNKLLNKISPVCVRKMVVSMRILMKVEFSKVLINPKVVKGQNEHKSGKTNLKVKNYGSIIVMVYIKDE